MKPIRVLNLFTVMDRGGAETMVMNYYRHIDRTKVQFDFLVLREKKGAYEDEILELGGKVYRICPIHPKNVLKYKKRIKEFFDIHTEYQIIHSHMSELGYFIFQEAAKRKIPVLICHAHGCPLKWDLKILVKTYLKIRIRKYTTFQLACGERAGKWLFGKNAKFYILNNAIDVKKFSYNREKRRTKRAELGIHEEIVIGQVANFSHAKNHEFVLDIFGEYLKLNPDAKLVLVGEGKLKSNIEDRAKEMEISQNILFLGARSDVNEILQAFDVFILPSLFEGVPVSVIEAQAAGLLCFISDRVPIECKITKNVKVINLQDGAKLWADKINQEIKVFYRKDMTDCIYKAEFDIHTTAMWLQDFYLNKINGAII